MKTLRSYADNRWHEASAGFSPLHDPSTGEPIARASSEGLDFAAILERARLEGGPALRGLTYAARGEIQQRRGAQAARADDERMRAKEALLRLLPELVQQQVAAVPEALGIVHARFGRPGGYCPVAAAVVTGTTGMPLR